MGKSSKKKIQKESRAKPLLKDKPLEAEETSVKWSLFRNPFFHLILITIIGLIAYSNTFTVPFHFDDTPNIVENYKLRDLSNLWPPSGPRWFGFLTFALNYHLGGLDTTGYHIVNLTIHILNAILVYLLVILTFKTPYFMVRQAHHDATVTLSHEPVEWSKGHHSPIHPFSSASDGQAYLPLFIALLFVSHPIQTQAVTYIVQRFTSLATFFYLLSLVMYIKFRSQQSAISGQQKLHATRYTLYAVSLISAILAMKTKEIAFTLPVIITLYEFMFFEGKIKKRILYLIPFLLTMLIIPLSLIEIDKPIEDAIGELREAAQEIEEISRWSYLFTQFRIIVTYIRLLFLPINQNLDYDYPLYHSFFNPEVFLSFMFLLSILILGIYLLYRSRHTTNLQNSNSEHQMLSIPTRYTLHATPSHFKQVRGIRLAAFGILWFFITLSVESSIIPISDVIFEHRVYLPSVGAAIAFSIAVFYVLQFSVHRSRIFTSYFPLPTSYFLLMSTLVVTLSIATYQRNIVWKDEMNLWEDVVKKSPNKARGHNEVGVAYKDKGWFDKAIEHYQIALRLKPDLPEVHNNLGIAYSNKEWFDTAIEHYQTALRLKPDFPIAHNNIGNAYAAKGWIDKAIEHYWFALRLKPDFIEAHNNLGVAYERKGLLEEAIKEYQTALMIDPEFKMARDNLNKLLRIKGK